MYVSTGPRSGPGFPPAPSVRIVARASGTARIEAIDVIKNGAVA